MLDISEGDVKGFKPECLKLYNNNNKITSFLKDKILIVCKQIVTSSTVYSTCLFTVFTKHFHEFLQIVKNTHC